MNDNVTSYTDASGTPCPCCGCGTDCENGTGYIKYITATVSESALCAFGTGGSSNTLSATINNPTHECLDIYSDPVYDDDGNQIGGSKKIGSQCCVSAGALGSNSNSYPNACGPWPDIKAYMEVSYGGCGPDGFTVSVGYSGIASVYHSFSVPKSGGSGSYQYRVINYPDDSSKDYIYDFSFSATT